jgi:hypothetical protein
MSTKEIRNIMHYHFARSLAPRPGPSQPELHAILPQEQVAHRKRRTSRTRKRSERFSMQVCASVAHSPYSPSLNTHSWT